MDKENKQTKCLVPENTDWNFNKTISQAKPSFIFLKFNLGKTQFFLDSKLGGGSEIHQDFQISREDKRE
jgi:hypothetical protein